MHEIGQTPMHAGQAFEGIATDGARLLLASQAGDGGIWTDQGQLSKTRGYGFRRIAGPVPSGPGPFLSVV